MPLKKGSIEIGSIKIGSIEIGSIKIGDKEIVNPAPTAILDALLTSGNTGVAQGFLSGQAGDLVPADFEFNGQQFNVIGFFEQFGSITLEFNVSIQGVMSSAIVEYNGIQSEFVLNFGSTMLNNDGNLVGALPANVGNTLPFKIISITP